MREYTDEEIEEGLRAGVVLGLSKQSRQAWFEAGRRARERQEEACLKIILGIPEIIARQPGSSGKSA